MSKTRIIYLLNLIHSTLIEKWAKDGLRDFESVGVDIGFYRRLPSGYTYFLADHELMRLKKEALNDMLVRAIMWGLNSPQSLNR